MKRIVRLLVAFLFLATALYMAVSITEYVFKALRVFDKSILITILAGSATITASALTVIAGRAFERRNATDAYFRERKLEKYEEILTILFSLIDAKDQSKDDLIARLNEWQRKLMLFAGPKTIKSFVTWIENLKSSNYTIGTFLLMDDFFLSLRYDLGLSNRRLQRGDFSRLLLKNGALFAKMAKKDPNMPLAKLTELEKIFEQEAGNPLDASLPPPP